MQEDYEVKSDHISLILVEIAGEQFAIDLLDVKEIIKTGHIRRLPKSLDFVDGIYNYRGDIIHVVNLNKKLNLETCRVYTLKGNGDENGDSSNNFIIIINVNESNLGFFVDKFCIKSGRSHFNVAPANKSLYRNYAWPGNIAELKDQVRQMIMLDSAEWSIDRSDVQTDGGEVGPFGQLAEITDCFQGASHPSLKEVCREYGLHTEKKIMKRVLENTNWNYCSACKRCC